MILRCARPWLCADLGAPHRVISWALHRGGIVTAERIVWREVRGADLPEGFEVAPWFAAEMAGRGAAEAVGGYEHAPEAGHKPVGRQRRVQGLRRMHLPGF